MLYQSSSKMYILKLELSSNSAVEEMSFRQGDSLTGCILFLFFFGGGGRGGVLKAVTGSSCNDKDELNPVS